MSTSCVVDSPSRVQYSGLEDSMYAHKQCSLEQPDVMSFAFPNRSNTALFFDWDDTLLASSWLAANGFRLDSKEEVPPEALAQLQVLEQAVLKVLIRAMEYGEVHLVTNAESGWIELSAQRFLPGVVPLLSQVKIMSARTVFEAHFPNQPKQWKVEAFRHQISTSFDYRMDCESKNGMTDISCLNIVSFGDSIHEREAIQLVTSELAAAFSKSVKFVERPTMEQLQRQLDLMHDYMDHIATHKGNLDLMLTIQLLQ